ncbi:MAG: GDSL-like Lipase/Acylhydrolase [Nocardioides sp.]|nr:GDSL-like Lipase/Acylhydrolase [Nocardioides sp.]
MSRARGWVAVGVLVLLVAVVAVVLRARSGKDDDVENARLRTVFVGDSITQADSPSYGARPGAGSWVRYAVDDDRSPWAFDANVALAGQTLAQLAARFESDVLARRPEAVVIMGGTNDVLQGLPVDASAESLAAMVREARAAGAEVWVIGPPPIDRLYLRPVDAMAQAEEEVARETGATYVDLGDSLVDPDGDWLPGLSFDGVHPTPHGARALAEAVLDGLGQ